MNALGRATRSSMRFFLGSLVIAGSMIVSGSAWADDPPAVGIFSDIEIGVGEVLDDDVVCIGGTATVRGKVRGDVVVVSGSLILSGEVTGDVVTVLGKTRLDPGAVVGGELIHVLGRLDKDPTAVVKKQTTEVGAQLPGFLQWIFSKGFFGLILLGKIFSLAVALILVLLISLLAPERVQRMSYQIGPRWPPALGIGILAGVGAVVVCVVLAITFIGAPVAALLAITVKVVGAMGVAAILAAIGRKVGSGSGLTGAEPSILVSVLFGFVLMAIVRFIPLVGELVWLIIAILGLGLALVSKLGSPSAGDLPDELAETTAEGTTS